MHDTDDIARRAVALIDELGRAHAGAPLRDLGWVFAFDRARTRLGLCTWRRGRTLVRRITLSRPLAQRLGWEVMEDVARHEVAHALDYEARGRSAHDAAWRAWARRCGADPTATYEGPMGDDPASPLVGRCVEPGCGYARPLYRRPIRSQACVPCRRRGRLSVLAVVDRESGEPVAAGADAAPWVGVCPACAGRVGFTRRPRGIRACAACCRRGGRGFDPRYALRIVRRTRAPAC